jgi:hypothetical protein
MFTKRLLTIVLVASAVILAVGIGPGAAFSARALPLAQANATIPYSGSLTNEVGQPVTNGAYDFSFALYSAETGGEPLWSEAQEGVTVQGGAFTALLGSAAPLPQEALAGGAHWLAVAVRGPGESAFSALTPRQKISAASLAAPAAPQALSCAHTHLYENWVGSDSSYALRIENDGSGVGLIANSTSSGDAARAIGVNGLGLEAMSDSKSAIYASTGGANRDNATVRAWNYNSTNGEAAFMQNTSVVHTAHFYNSGSGGVLYLHNDGAADGSGGGDFITAVNSDETDTQFRVTSNGGVLTDAGFRCGDGAPGCLQTGSADVAERVNASEALEPGDVVEIDPAHPDHFRLARTPYSTLLAGVISTNPAIIMNVQGVTLAGDSVADERPPLALLGRVPVRVSAENGPIGIGDLLVASSTPGLAMRGVNPPPGTILGKALEPLASGTGVILVLVTLQ